MDLQTWTALQCDGTIHLSLWLDQVRQGIGERLSAIPTEEVRPAPCG